jgi:multidrug efflux pump subunit AcrA (membrane-fusion protein)
MGAALMLGLWAIGCAGTDLRAERSSEKPEACAVTPSIVNVEQAQLFREAETERATELVQEIVRLQADLKTAESALVEAESGLAGTHTRADAVSSLATARIQILRAESRAPWRSSEIVDARGKLEEAERQVQKGHFGAGLFFVYRARRVADSILNEAEIVAQRGGARLIRARRVNLRSGPSVSESVLSVLTRGTPVFPQADEGEWMLVQVSSGPSGWIHRRLVGELFSSEIGEPAAPLP